MAWDVKYQINALQEPGEGYTLLELAEAFDLAHRTADTCIQAGSCMQVAWHVKYQINALQELGEGHDPAGPQPQ